MLTVFEFLLYPTKLISQKSGLYLKKAGKNAVFIIIFYFSNNRELILRIASFQTSNRYPKKESPDGNSFFSHHYNGYSRNFFGDKPARLLNAAEKVDWE